MGDLLEQFISENRDSFDSPGPSDRVWKGIDSQINKKKTHYHLIWRVAAFLFLGSTIFLLIDRIMIDTSSGPEYSLEFTETEAYYINLIDQKRNELAESLSPEQQKELFSEMDQLDNMYLDLKSDYDTNAVNERLLDAMINNLQIRLEILNKQLEIMERIKAGQNESESTIEI